LQDLVLCLERSVIYSSPEVLLPEVCQGRLYLFDIQAVIWLGALIRQGLKAPSHQVSFLTQPAGQSQ
jgi:hypothetical protein